MKEKIIGFEKNIPRATKDLFIEEHPYTPGSKNVEGILFTESSVWGRLLDSAIEIILQKSGSQFENKQKLSENMLNAVLEELRAHPSLKLKTLTDTFRMRLQQEASSEAVEKTEAGCIRELANFIEEVFVEKRRNLVAQANDDTRTLH